MDQVQAGAAGSGLPHYADRLRRRWWALPISLILGVGLGYGLTVSQPDVYSSETSVLVLPTFPALDFSSAGGRTGSAIDLDTEAQLVRSAQVADAAIELLSSDSTAAELLRRVSVTVPDSSQVLRIVYTASSPEQAQAGASAFADAYLALRTSDAQTELDATEKILSAQVADLNAKLKDATDSAAKLAQNSPARAFAEAQRGILVSQINDINGRLIPLEATAVNPGQIIAAATLPAVSSAVIPPLNLAVGLLAALVLIAALVWLADRLDHRIRHRSDVHRHVNVPVLDELAVDLEAPGGPQLGDELAARFDLMRNDILGAERHMRLFQVTGATAEGASALTAVQLARSLSRTASEPALLVVATTDSRAANWSALRSRPGLVEVLRGEVSVDDVAVTLAGGGVRAIAPGLDSGALEHLLQTPAFQAFLSTLRAGSAPVVVETAGLDDSASAQTVASACDTVVLVAQAQHSDGRRLAVCVTEAGHMGTPVAGVVLLRSKRERAAKPGSSGSGGAALPAAPVELRPVAQGVELVTARRSARRSADPGTSTA